MRGVIGVDVGRRVHVAVAPGAPVLRFSADLRGFEALGVYGDALGGGWRVGLEPTGTYAEPLIAWLLARGVEVYAVSPQQARRGRGLFGRETRKSDDQDAAVIAALVAAGVGRRVEPWVGAFRELRVLATQRERQVQVRDRATRRLDAWAARHLPELTGPFDGTAVLGEGLAGTVGVPVGPADRLVCAQLVAESALAARHLGEVDAAMALAAASVPYAAGWATIPGLGARTIAVVLGELGDVRRFPTAAPLVAYAGLDFTSAQSGAVAAKGRPSRRGRAVARRYLWLAVLRLGRGAFASVRERQRARGMPPGKAAVANMRRLLRVLFAMAKDGTVFRAAAGG